MRVIALDVGDKTIGVAVSDELMLTAQGVETIERVGIRKDADRVLKHVKDFGCKTVVVGLPKNLNGTDSVQTEKVYAFHDMLANKMRSTGMSDVELVYQDERFTTKIAENVLIEANMRRDKRKKVIDKQAAVIILQSYLDAVAVSQGKSLFGFNDISEDEIDAE